VAIRAVVSLSVLLLTVFGAAWYVSGRLMAIPHVRDTHPLRVLASDPRRGRIVLDRGPDAAEPGTFRLAWSSGRAIVGAVLATTASTVTRRVSAVEGRLAAGTRVGIEPDRYTGDPATALGLPFSTVTVPTSLGAMPAWYLPDRRSTWAILIHGLGGSRADTLPPMPALHALGYPMLAISYRNDVGAPLAPDRHSHLGASEWHDVAAAVGYALAHGAGGVVLYGYSLGGAMALILARDPMFRDHIRAVVLDSPLLDWPATMDYAAQREGIPRPLAELTETVLSWRGGIDYAQFDQLAHERALSAPVLLLQGTSDTVVPPQLAARFARERPNIVTYVPIAGADHVSGIDTSPRTYEAALRRLLAKLP
jgi:pimeloyl-ACP methyl ester carboxylesterase